jgi:uncharacterized membrane protein YccF (DUF307 family)
MSSVGNLIWIIFGGLLSAIGWTIAGLLLCITVIGIPFGVQCLKIAGLTLAPFGREVSIGNFGAGGLLMNIIWILLLGWELCIMHLIIAFFLGITIVGLPFAKQHLKLAGLALLPFKTDKALYI